MSPLTKRALAKLMTLRRQKSEHFVALYLNGRHQLVHTENIAVAGQDRSLVLPSEAFVPAARRGATAVIIAHNHPGGDVGPAADDCELTHNLRDFADLLGVPLYDHLVVSRNSYFSFREHGYLV